MLFSTQALLMLGFSIILAANVYGFAAWSVESPEKFEILQVLQFIFLHQSTAIQIPSISWARNQSQNFLVLGKQYGDIGLFGRGDNCD